MGGGGGGLLRWCRCHTGAEGTTRLLWTLFATGQLSEGLVALICSRLVRWFQMCSYLTYDENLKAKRAHHNTLIVNGGEISQCCKPHYR